ncbi:hypothetical protein [Streptomyces sp. NPDC060002]|uniref:hypothetical protein n=1 Tax=Streptomyces sp. NPDC060002 TaxID=3347033 RepID=UPI0036B481A7
MHFVGFYRQLEPQGPAVYSEDIQEALGTPASYPVSEVVAYLRAGHPILDVSESCLDVVDGQGRIRSGSSVLSDGEWVWRWDLGHYVEKYAVDLPDGFLAGATGNAFRVPAVPRERLIEISLAVNEALGFRPAPGSGPRRKDT